MTATIPVEVPRHRVLLLPGSVLPAEFAYGVLLEGLGAAVDAHAKDLEVYPTETPPPGRASTPRSPA